MQQQTVSTEEIHYPYIIFKINGGLYCVNSKYIATILQLPEHEPIPDAPPHVTGIFPYRNGIVEMFDIRSALGISTIESEYETFSEMLEARKNDHILWVSQLERSLTTGEPFTLATDPHQCAFGKWYYSQTFENNVVSYQLQQIEDPHSQLHHTAIEAEEHKAQNGGRLDPEYKVQLMDRIQQELMPQILTHLDETKVIFQNNVFHGMVLLLNGESGVGLVVDEVLSVENLTPNTDSQSLHTFKTSRYISSIQKSEKTDSVILELNIKDLMQDCGVAI